MTFWDFLCEYAFFRRLFGHKENKHNASAEETSSPSQYGNHYADDDFESPYVPPQTFHHYSEEHDDYDVYDDMSDDF